MHNWITLLYTWNKHNILNQIYFNKIKKNFKYNFSTTQKSIINQETAVLWSLGSNLTSDSSLWALRLFIDPSWNSLSPSVKWGY